MIDTEPERKPNVELNPIQEIHQTYSRSSLALFLQAFSALGTAFMLVVVFYGAEWKGGVDADRQLFKEFIQKGDRYPLHRGVKLESQIDQHENRHDEDLKELRQEWLDELRLIRKDIKEARDHSHRSNS